MTDRNIADCYPELQALIPKFIANCAAWNIIVRVIVTYRDADEQNAAEAEGLSKACAGQSAHNCTDADGNPRSKAFDFGVFEDDGSYVKDGTDPRYATAAQVARDLGLWVGADWPKPDFDHVELANWKEIA